MRDTAQAAAVRQAIVAGNAESGIIAAATGYARCPAGYFCMFAGYDGGGGMAYFRNGSANLTAQGMNNSASSFWNRASYAFRAYDGTYFTGYTDWVGAGAWNNLSWSDNKWSSLYRA